MLDALVPDEVGGNARERDRSRRHRVSAMRYAQRHARILLDQQHAHFLVAIDGDDRAGDVLHDLRARRRATARRAAGASAWPSARGRSPASAARRRSSCRPPGATAPSGAETAPAPRRATRATPALSERENAPIIRLSRTHICGNTRRPSGTMAMPSLTIAAGSSPSMRWPSKAIEPLRIRLRPVMARRIDDLPAPFAPMSATVSPSLTSIETPLQRIDVVVVEFDAVEGEHRGPSSRARSFRLRRRDRLRSPSRSRGFRRACPRRSSRRN